MSELTKEETDALILSQVTEQDNKINETHFRNTESQHPKDCSCDLCKSLRFSESYPKAENEFKEKEGWYNESN